MSTLALTMHLFAKKKKNLGVDSGDGAVPDVKVLDAARVVLKVGRKLHALGRIRGLGVHVAAIQVVILGGLQTTTGRNSSKIREGIAAAARPNEP